MRWCVLMVAALLPAAAGAQEPTGAPLPRPDASAAAPAEELAALPAEEGLLSDDALDDLVAPVALYPNSLLTQVLVAATYPLDVMKADRFLDDNADLPDQERADLVDLEDWDESVRVLAAGFPDVLARMADDIDWTEELGDAMLAQTDDLLDAVQRLRAQADAAGNLESNEAQTVEVEGDSISIAPADPQVVYVPAYDPQTVYTTPVDASRRWCTTTPGCRGAACSRPGRSPSAARCSSTRSSTTTTMTGTTTGTTIRSTGTTTRSIRAGTSTSKAT